MEMIFFSSDRAEIEVLREALAGVSIPSEVRDAGSAGGTVLNGSQTELWIQNDADSHRAVMLCVEMGLGFAKRPHSPKLVEAESEAC